MSDELTAALAAMAPGELGELLCDTIEAGDEEKFARLDRAVRGLPGADAFMGVIDAMALSSDNPELRARVLDLTRDWGDW